MVQIGAQEILAFFWLKLKLLLKDHFHMIDKIEKNTKKNYIEYWDNIGRILIECSPVTSETGVQSQVESYQKFKKWYLIPPCLTLRIIRYISRVKWSNPGKWVAPSPTPQCSSYWKGSFRVVLDYGHQFYLVRFWKEHISYYMKIHRVIK